MRKAVVLLFPLTLAPLGACVSTVTSVATAPFKAVGKVADWTTTSQEESDRNYGRKMRHKEAEEGRKRREWAKQCKKTPDAPDCREYSGPQAGRN